MIYRLLLFIPILLLSGCSYSFTGASISPDSETFSVTKFPNNAPLVVPTLSNVFTEKLKDKVLNSTTLDAISRDGDVRFDGSITQFATGPVNIQGNQTAAQSRLTIGVRVVFVDKNDNKKSWEANFSRFADYPRTQDLSLVQDALTEDILDQLINDIFLKAFANW
jgi:hypothetical protein